MNSITFDTAPSLPDEVWFAPTTTPAKQGLYKRRIPMRKGHLLVWAWWDGKHWYAASFTKKQALHYRDTKIRTTVKEAAWCGLARRTK